MKRRRLIIAGGFVTIVVGLLLATPHLLPLALGGYRPDIRFAVATSQKRVFLTIDDAPSTSTEAILSVLQKHQVPATFFVISGHVSSDAQLRQIVESGHALGNHLRTTKACSQLTLEEFRTDFDACAARLAPLQSGRYFRPASDFGTPAQIAYARSRGYEALMGTAFPLDHWLSSPAILTRLAGWLAIPGAIVILHDGNVRGRTTAEVLDLLIPRLKAAGYGFGRLGEVPDQSDPTNTTGGPD